MIEFKEKMDIKKYNFVHLSIDLQIVLYSNFQ